MKKHSIHVAVPNSLNALVQIEADRTGDSLATVVRRCIRTTLGSQIGSKEYEAAYRRLREQNGEED